MKIGHKKYLRTYIALSSIAASLLVGNKVAFAEEGDGTVGESAPIESTDPMQATESSTEEETEAAMPMPVETILDAGGYGADQLTGMTQPNAYVVVCAEESKVGEQTADEVGRFAVPLGALPDGTATLQVKVYKDATQTFLLAQTEWLVPVAEVTEVVPGEEAEDQQTIPTEPSSSAGQETQPEVTNDDSNTEQTEESNTESTDTEKNEETVEAPLLPETTAASTAPVAEEAKGTWYYYVQSGDTLQKIATHYNTDVTSLMRWNRLTSTLINIGQLLSVNGTNAYAEIDKETRTFATTAEFVNYLGQYATEIGNDYNLYASVMVAQASLETAYGSSKLSTVGNNLFGIKGSYAGNSIVMRTWEEESDGSIIWIDAFFRLYPSYYESMIDYAEKLRNGVSWDPNYYKGTWKENTTSYQDATLYLTGRYATDSSYYTKLNAIISAYDLNKFDGPKTVAVNFNAIVSSTNFSIDSLPWGTIGYKYLEPSSNYYGKEVTVTKQTVDGQYALISYGGKEVGWIDRDALKTLSTVPASYTLPIMNSGYSIDSLPWGEPGFVRVGDTAAYYGKMATVIRETANGIYAEISVDGIKLGWVDYRAFESFDATIVHYTAVVSGTNYSIDSQPWGEAGYVYLDSSANYYGKEVVVTRKTSNGAYAYISLDGKPLGWIDSRGLQNFSTVAINYNLPIMNGIYSIDSLPWGEPGYTKIADAAAYFGKLATVLRESTNGAYAEIAIDGQRIGWIDKRAFSNARQVSYYAGVSGQNYSIDSLPWGTAGYQYLNSTNNYLGILVKVVAESIDGNYKLIQLNGQNLGWVDYRALAVLNTKAVNYAATIRSVGYSIDSLPWGTSGFTMLGLTSSYLNTAVQVIQESADGHYALVMLNGKTLGWVDKRCF